MGQCLENMGDVVRPGSQGIRGFPWSPSLCGVRCVKEARPESRRRPPGKLAQFLYHGSQLAAVKVRNDRFADWEELIMNETAAAPPNTEHELLLEAGRFWSRYWLTSHHPHLQSAPVH